MFTQDINCLKWMDKYITKQSSEEDLDWEEEELDKKLTIVDVGMNEGDFALLCLSYFNSYEVVVHGFEPNKHINPKTELKKYETNLVPNNVALSDTNTNQTLYVPTNNKEKYSKSHLSSLIDRPVFSTWQDGHVETQNVSVVTLDHYVKENNIEKIDYLKVDVEGNELNVLKGAQKCLTENKITAGQFEYGSTLEDANISLEDIIVFLEKFQYSCFLGPAEKHNKISTSNLKQMLSKSPDQWENITFVDNNLLEF